MQHWRFIACAGLVAFGCRSKPKPAGESPPGGTTSSSTQSPPIAESAPAASSAKIESAPPLQPCPDLETTSWPSIEAQIDERCHFHYAEKPEEVPLSLHWQPCADAWPEGCTRLVMPGSRIDIMKALVDADRQVPRLLLTWRCGGYATVVADADGSPPKWAVYSAEANCFATGVAIEGDVVWAELDGNGDDGTSDPGPAPASILFGRVQQKPPRVQHRVGRGNYIRELVADAHHWGNLADDGFYAAEIGGDRGRVVRETARVDQLRMGFGLAVWQAAASGQEVHGYSFDAAGDAFHVVGAARPHAKIFGLAVGPRDVVWSDRIDPDTAKKQPDNCAFADVARTFNKAPRFTIACPRLNTGWTVGKTIAAAALDDGRLAFVRLVDKAVAYVAPPCRGDTTARCSCDALALNDRESFWRATVGYNGTVVRIPLPSFDGAATLAEIDESADAGADAATADTDAGGRRP